MLTHPDVVRETHEEYIRAGAKVIITNTFGSTRQMLEPAGYGDQVEAINRGAVKLARQARDNVAEQAVAVAGSISSEPPGFDRDAFFSPAKELDAYREAAGLLADDARVAASHEGRYISHIRSEDQYFWEASSTNSSGAEKDPGSYSSPDESPNAPASNSVRNRSPISANSSVSRDADSPPPLPGFAMSHDRHRKRH